MACRIELIEAAGPTAGPDGAAGAPADDGFHSVTLWLSDPAPTARVLTDLFGYEEAGQEATDGTERLRFRSPAGGRGSVVDLIRSDAPSIGQAGRGHDPPRRVPRRDQGDPARVARARRRVRSRRHARDRPAVLQVDLLPRARRRPVRDRDRPAGLRRRRGAGRARARISSCRRSTRGAGRTSSASCRRSGCRRDPTTPTRGGRSRRAARPCRAPGSR